MHPSCTSAAGSSPLSDGTNVHGSHLVAVKALGTHGLRRAPSPNRTREPVGRHKSGSGAAPARLGLGAVHIHSIS